MSAQAKSWLMSPKGITWASVAVNIALTAAKIAAGVFCRSQTILADGLHSGSDLVTDVAVLAGLRVSNRPADGCHPYGHRRVSTLVAMFVGAALSLAAAWIAYEAITGLHDYMHGIRRDVRANLPFWLAAGSAPVKELMYQLTRYVGRKHRDVSLVANAWHHRTDAFAAIAAAVGLAGVLFGGQAWLFLDPMTAIVLAAFLVAVSYKISAATAAELIDRAPGARMLAFIEKVVSETSGVRSHHAFRARQIGGKIATDIHIQVEPTLTVRQGHEIAAAVKRRVMDADPDVVEVIVHIEPAES